MQVLLVACNRERIPDPVFPLGLAYVAAAVRQAGHRVAVADLCFGTRPLASLCRQVTDFQPDVIGLSIRNVDNAAYPLTVDYLTSHSQVVTTLRGATDAPIVLGGSGFSILPREYMKTLGGDWGVVGEGEQTFVRLLDALNNGSDPCGISGVITHWVDHGSEESKEFTRIPPENLLQNWGAGLRPARELFDYRRYVRRGGMGNIQTKRGCVFKCSYCTYPLLEGNRFRVRSAEDVADELEQLLWDYGPHPVFFVDSILNFPSSHIETICEEIIRRRIFVRWSCYATPVKFNRQQAQLMARAGCEGVELGSDAVDNNQLQHLGKSFNTDAVERANRYCLEAGLRVCHTVIFGAPGETQASIKNTCQALRAMRPTAVVAMTGVRLYPGTPLTNQLIAQGHLQKDEAALLPTFYIEPEVRDFLPNYLMQQARDTGNWVLPGLSPPILPSSQRLIRALGVSGPLWRLLQSPLIRALSRTKFQHPNTSWGIPNPRRKIV